jgi:hypothetical protein
MWYREELQIAKKTPGGAEGEGEKTVNSTNVRGELTETEPGQSASFRLRSGAQEE